MKIACCGKFMIVSRQGINVLELASFGPYKLWSADAYKCTVCGTTVAAGFGNRAYAEHFQDGFSARVAWAEKSDAGMFTVQ